MQSASPQRTASGDAIRFILSMHIEQKRHATRTGVIENQLSREEI